MITINATVHVHLADTREVAEINAKLDRLLQQGAIDMASTAELLAAVSAQTTVIAGVGEFIVQLKAQLLANGVAQADIDAAFEGVTANTTTAALFVNTPTPAPEPAPEPLP